MGLHLSLCSGIGGLDLPFGGADVFAETEPAPAEVLAARFPDTPNIGDWTALDDVNEFNLLTGGLPCQPVSAAGKGRSDKDDRYLFDDLVRILRSSDVRPTLVLENVRGILFPRNAVPFWRFVSSLAHLGYVGRWEVVRASDVGAPHRRERWFCVASHPHSEGSQGRRTAHDRIGKRNAGPTGLGVRRKGDKGRGLESLKSSEYGPAVSRWERVVGRTAPGPVDDMGRLSSGFVEWLMGYPEGYVTDILGRVQAIKALGNAVVPQQASLAMAILGYGDATGCGADATEEEA